MKIKRYLVNNMPEAMETIKRDLGSNAILISSRWVKQGGFLSFLRPHKLEVIAAVEEKSAVVQDSTLSKDVAELKALLKSVSGLGKDYTGNNDLKEQSNLLLKWQNVLQELELGHEVTNHLLQDIRDNRVLSQDENEKLLKEAVESRLLQIFEDSLQGQLEKKDLCFCWPHWSRENNNSGQNCC